VRESLKSFERDSIARLSAHQLKVVSPANTLGLGVACRSYPQSHLRAAFLDWHQVNRIGIRTEDAKHVSIANVRDRSVTARPTTGPQATSLKEDRSLTETASLALYSLESVIHLSYEVIPSYAERNSDGITSFDQRR